MKKSLVALAAVLSFSAYADNAVTLYGIADAWIGSAKHIDLSRTNQPNAGVNPANSSNTVVDSGGLADSRIGLSAEEDLGGGLSAFVNYEIGTNLDTGANAGTRQAVLGFSGGFGRVALGFQATPFDDMLGASIYTQDSVFDGFKHAEQFYYPHTARTSNSVRYDTPNFDGFSAAVQMGLGENKGAARATRNTSATVRYATGPLDVAVGVQTDEITPGFKTTNAAIGGAYDFGAVKLNLGMTRSKDTNRKNENGVNLGVSLPLGPVTVKGQIGRHKASDMNDSTNSFGIEAHYALSKRTTAYAGFMEVRQQRVFKDRKFGGGVKHVF